LDVQTPIQFVTSIARMVCRDLLGKYFLLRETTWFAGWKNKINFSVAIWNR